MRILILLRLSLGLITGCKSVLAFLIILTSGLQYVVQKMNYSRDLARVQQFIIAARTAAWGPKMVPLSGARKAWNFFLFVLYMVT